MTLWTVVLISIPLGLGYLFLTQRDSGGGTTDDALTVLRRRYASGELDEEDFDARRRKLPHDAREGPRKSSRETETEKRKRGTPTTRGPIAGGVSETRASDDARSVDVERRFRKVDETHSLVGVPLATDSVDAHHRRSGSSVCDFSFVGDVEFFRRVSIVARANARIRSMASRDGFSVEEQQRSSTARPRCISSGRVVGS